MNIISQFPLLSTHPNLVYLDSGATSQTPQRVLDAMEQYYTEYKANIHRGIYTIGEQATDAYEDARKTVAQFINAEPEEIIFVRNATEAMNLGAFLLAQKKSTFNRIATSILEHHSSFLPAQHLSKKHHVPLDIFPLNSARTALDMEVTIKMIEQKPDLVTLTHMSNTLGITPDVERIISHVHDHDGFILIDAAQSIAHLPIDVKQMDCDALAFSGHKMFGPMGIGVLYLRKNLHEGLQPLMVGGGMITDVTTDDATWADIPYRFEYGTPAIAESIGLAEAVRFIQDISFDAIQHHETQLLQYAHEQLLQINGLTILGPDAMHKGPIISFLLEDIHPHDIATIINDHGVCVRAGHHCTKPLMNIFDSLATTRASFSIYNTKEDIDKLINALHNVKKIFA